MSLAEQAITARWVISMEGPVLSPGTVRWTGDRITGIEAGADPQADDLGEVALLPGFINAHTHLEFSHLTEPVPAGKSFAHWIANVIEERRHRTVTREASVRQGLEECRASGTAFVGEIQTGEAVHEGETAGVVFREFLGLSSEQIPRHLAQARAFLSQETPPGVVHGLSPHAPYSTHPELVHGLVQLAKDHAAPLAMHLAESPEEIELLTRGSGPLVRLFRKLGVWRDDVLPRGTSPLEILKSLAEAPRVLVVHGTLLTPPAQHYLARNRQFSVVYCPRTSSYFGFRPHPWKAMRRQGVRVVLGTDGRASNPDLNLLRELKSLLRSAPELGTETLLSMVTREAAVALGIEAWAGTLSVGKIASLTILRPASTVLDSQGYPDLLGEQTWPSALLDRGVLRRWN